jgi:hypothetical protein
MTDVGKHPDAPRQWSHAHLSKIERAKEWPKEDLVAWYEEVCGAAPGSLLTLYRDAVGDTSIVPPEPIAREMRQWIDERVEVHVDLSAPTIVVTEQRDIVAVGDGLDRHLLLIESDTPFHEDSLAVIGGGEIAGPPVWQVGAVAAVPIRLPRTYVSGDWHRVTVRFAIEPSAAARSAATIFARHRHTRDAVVSLRFPAGATPTVWRIENAYSEEVEAAFNPLATAAVSSLIPNARQVTVDGNGEVSARFRPVRPGLEFGLGWR